MPAVVAADKEGLRLEEAFFLPFFRGAAKSGSGMAREIIASLSWRAHWFGVQDYGIFTCFLIRERRRNERHKYKATWTDVESDEDTMAEWAVGMTT